MASNVVQMDFVAAGTVDDGLTLGLKKDQIIRLWEMKVLNDLAYVSLLLFYELAHNWRDRIEDAGGEFSNHIQLTSRDYDYLCRKWQGITPKNDDGDVKPLTFEIIEGVLLNLAKKEFAIAQTQQLSLHLSCEAPIGGAQ